MQSENVTVVNHLLIRAKDGDRAAEEELFGHLLVRFNLFAIHTIGNAEIAREIAQRACIAVLEKYKTETFSVGFEEWAWGVLRIIIKNHFRQASIDSRRLNSEFHGLDSAHQVDVNLDPEVEMQVLKCLKKVSAVNRRFARILNLFYQGYKTEEICKKLGIGQSHCYVMLHRGRSMLKKCLETGGI